jgi:hypothetical protein
MNIENPKWMDDLKECISVTINGKHMSVPKDEPNKEYREILAWVAEGNSIADAD